MFELKCPTPKEWVEGVLDRFDAFLVDHAACERKASATGISFVVRYPDRAKLVEPMIAFAREELEHFHQVVQILSARGLQLGADEQDPYINGLLAEVRTGRDPRLLDRLLTAGIVEARGCERFGMIARAQPDAELKRFYARLAQAEARHHVLFAQLAAHYFPETEIAVRLDELLDTEAHLIASLPLRAALH